MAEEVVHGKKIENRRSGSGGGNSGRRRRRAVASLRLFPSTGRRVSTGLRFFHGARPKWARTGVVEREQKGEMSGERRVQEINHTAFKRDRVLF